MASIEGDPRTYRARARFLPDRAEIAAVLERLDWLIYPGYFGSREVSAAGLEAHVTEVIGELVPRLFDQLSAALRYDREPGAATTIALHVSAKRAIAARAKCSARSSAGFLASGGN